MLSIMIILKMLKIFNFNLGNKFGRNIGLNRNYKPLFLLLFCLQVFTENVDICLVILTI